jgi:hypothetical protein
MFSPTVHAVRQKIFSQVIHSPLASPSTKPTESEVVNILDPDTLLGADQVAFFDLKEYEDHYDILMSTSFDFCSLNFTQSIIPTECPDINTEALINALPARSPSTQKFIYRLNALKLLLGYVCATQCAHPTIVAQKEALTTAITVKFDELVYNARRQWSLQSSGIQEGHGLRVVQARKCCFLIHRLNLICPPQRTIAITLILLHSRYQS